MKKILITTLIMMAATMFAEETKAVILNQENKLPEPVVQKIEVEEPKAEVVTVPVEAIPSLTAEQLNRILERDRQRAQWIKERMEEGKAKEEEENKSPVISKKFEFDYHRNPRMWTVDVKDEIEIRLEAEDDDVWTLNDWKDDALVFSMKYNSEDGEQPIIVVEDDPLAEVNEFENKKEEDKEDNRNRFNNGRLFYPSVRIWPTEHIRRGNKQIFVFKFKAVKEGTQKITLKHTDNHMYIQMIGAYRRPPVPPFELTVKVKENK